MPTNEVLLASPQSAIDLNKPGKSRWRWIKREHVYGDKNGMYFNLP